MTFLKCHIYDMGLENGLLEGVISTSGIDIYGSRLWKFGISGHQILSLGGPSNL